jgi:uncharacterized membrane protein YdjX (TVP38/TMEM64 family)
MSPTSLWVLCALLFADGATLAVATTPLLLEYGKYHAPWVVALAGGAASALGSAVQILALRWVLDPRHPWTARLAPTREKITGALARYPSASFLALAVARATPLPDAPLKLVAAATGYPIPLYGAAVLLGSVPYYFVLALIGREVKLPTWLLAAAAVIILLGVALDRLRGRRRSGA